MPMTEAKVVGFCGNAQRPSKTRALVESIAAHLADRHGIAAELFDLADVPLDAFQYGKPSGKAKTLIEAIESADALIVGSPVYKGSYSGIFKHVFDLVQPSALVNRPVLLTATGGGARHCLMVEHQLRPLFGFFEACTVPTAVYASDADFADGRPASALVLQRVSVAAAQLAGLLHHQRFEAAE